MLLKSIVPIRSTKMRTSPNVKVVEITPELAHRYLENNSTNRPLSVRVVNELTRAILNDEWQVNGESIKFDNHRNLIDGQHRCHAVIKAHRPIQTFVSYDLPGDSFKTLDTGKKRNNADVLGIMGYSNPTQLAATARFIVNFQSNALRSNELVTNQQMEVFLDGNPRIMESLGFIKEVKVEGILPASVAAGLHFLMGRVDPEDAEKFFHDLAKGSMLAASDPVLLLREKLIYYKNRVGSNLSRRELVAHVIKAWNYRRTGKIVKRLTWAKKSGEEFPIIR